MLGQYFLLAVPIKKKENTTPQWMLVIVHVEEEVDTPSDVTIFVHSFLFWSELCLCINLLTPKSG